MKRFTSTKFGITSIGFVDCECLQGLLAEPLGDRGHAVALLDAESNDRVEGRLHADQGDIGSMERRDGRDAAIAQHLPREKGAGCMRNRVVDVEQVEVVLEGDLDELRGEAQRVGRVVEDGVVVGEDLMEVHVLGESLQADGRRVADEVDVAPSRRHRESQLRRDDPAPPVAGVADDSDCRRFSLAIRPSPCPPERRERGRALRDRTTRGPPPPVHRGAAFPPTGTESRA